MWMPDDGWALDYSADWMMNSLNSTLATDLRPHRHGILQSLSARYAKGRWVALARMLASVYLNSVGRKIEPQQAAPILPKQDRLPGCTPAFAIAFAFLSAPGEWYCQR